MGYIVIIIPYTYVDLNSLPYGVSNIRGYTILNVWQEAAKLWCTKSSNVDPRSTTGRSRISLDDEHRRTIRQILHLLHRLDLKLDVLIEFAVADLRHHNREERRQFNQLRDGQQSRVNNLRNLIDRQLSRLPPNYTGQFITDL